MSHYRQAGCGSFASAIPIAGVVMIALLSSGCSLLMPDKIHYVVDPTEHQSAFCDDADGAEPADRILGVALSGGGSRAAVFGAATLEALSEHGVLGQVSHLSSVSGGSIAAAYFLAYPPDCEDAMTPQAQQACWRDYFSGFKAEMRADFQSGMIWRNARPTRFSSPTRRALSLQEELDEEFLNGKTFGEVTTNPVVMFNATSYDETRRFVFSNACMAAGGADSPDAEREEAGKRYRLLARRALSYRAARAFTFSRPDCMRPVPNDLPVSLAVVASASFPPAIGPVAIEAPSGCAGGEPEWWHLGDGGVVENSGTDSLEEVLLRRLAADEPPPEQVLFLSVDSGVWLDAEELKRLDNFRMNSNPSRVNLVVHTPRVRGQVYHDIFWEELQNELVKDGIGYEMITFRHSEAKLAGLPASCAKDSHGEQSIREHLQEIPTLLKIDKCDADLLEMAAHQLVHTTLDGETVGRLAGEGYSIRTASECALAP